MAMASSRSNRKRSHHEVEDGDECLPISKRINSLHIEGQSHAVFPQPNGNHVHIFAGVHENAVAGGVESVTDASHQQDLNNPSYCHNHDLNNSESLRHHPVNGQAISQLHNINNMHNSCGDNVHFSRSMSDPYPVISNHLVSIHSRSSHTSSHQEQGSHVSSNDPEPLTQIQLLEHAASAPYFNCRLLAPLNNMDFGPIMDTNQQQIGSNLSFETNQSQSQHQSQYQSLNSLQPSFFQSIQNSQIGSVFGNAQNEQLSSYQNNQNQHSPFHCSSPGNSQPHVHSDYSREFHFQQMPSGSYEPELGMEENPYYFSVNQMLYEAHLSRIRRDSNFPGDSS